MTERTVNQLLKEYALGNQERVKKFIDTAKAELQNQWIQPGHAGYPGGPTTMNGHPITWCNQYVYNVLENLGYVLHKYYDKNGKGYTEINEFYDALRKYGDKIDFRYAQNFAKFGVPVIAIHPASGRDEGHVALLYPDEKIQDSAHDIAIIGAGSADVFGIKSAYDVFYKWGVNPEFFHILR